MAKPIRDLAREADMAQRYANGKTLRDVGFDFGLTHERVRQILSRAGAQLRPRGRRPDLFAQPTPEGQGGEGGHAT